MWVVDAFAGNNETVLAELRIEYLSKIVDYTVIVESALSHSGKHKPLYFSEWQARVRMNPLYKNVIVLELDLSSHSGAMEKDIATREYLQKYVYENFSNSHFILSDIDEIPSLAQLEEALGGKSNFHFLTPTSYLYANWEHRDSHKNWSRGIIGHTSLEVGPNGGRFTNWPTLKKNPGSHLSWMISISGELSTKISSTAHKELAELNVLSEKLVTFASKYGIDHLGRFYEQGFGILTIRGESSLTEVQSFVLLKRPDFFRFSLEKNKIIARFLASCICTTIWRHPRYGDGLNSTFIYRRFNSRHIFLAILLVNKTLLMGLLHFARRKVKLIIKF